MQLSTQSSKGFAPATITEAMEFSKMLAESSMVPRAYQGKPQDIMVCVQWGYEIGLAPMQALQNIAVINGKPSVYGDAAMALVQASPVCEGIDEHIENEGTPNPTAVCVAKRKGRNPVIARFSVEDAKRAGLWGKQGPWQAYPKRMLQMRARGFALRDAFPDVLKGLITVEEAADFQVETKDITPKPQPIPANPLDALPAVSVKPREPVELEDDSGRFQVEVEEVNRQLQDEAAVTEPESEQLEPVEAIGFALKVPGKDAPASVHETLAEWSDAYEAMADKVAKAGRAAPRDRMTKLKELRQANEATINRIDTLDRVKLTAAYSKRLAALGAASDKEATE
ncbi:MAG: hypothetical protein EBT15_07035 [Betaproteobacteria bacterium]|nr:hypothetical protein [Betaproteobacteria bacterium]